ncbi:MAG TPA: head GIN domain-containing protein [Pyrinomonadaceae bacterium]|jgi:hypothetical protein|nr:head GIN domain-containing protein [Pyrinomonadaceae bacterium]
MKKVGIIFFIAALILGVVLANIFSFGRIGSRIFHFSTNFGGVSGSGNIVTDKRDVVDFKAIDVGGIFKVEVTAQKDYSVEVVADDNLQPIIKTELDGDVLKISADKHIKSHEPIVIRISAPDIENVEASGASNVSVSNLKNSEFALNTSGASKVAVQGETARLNIDVSGASNINAEGLKADNARVDASGASKVSVFALDELWADASGASKIVYTGTPKNFTNKTSGASSVTQK